MKSKLTLYWSIICLAILTFIICILLLIPIIIPINIRMQLLPPVTRQTMTSVMPRSGYIKQIFVKPMQVITHAYPVARLSEDSLWLERNKIQQQYNILRLQKYRLIAEKKNRSHWTSSIHISRKIYETQQYIFTVNRREYDSKIQYYQNYYKRLHHYYIKAKSKIKRRTLYKRMRDIKKALYAYKNAYKKRINTELQKVNALLVKNKRTQARIQHILRNPFIWVNPTSPIIVKHVFVTPKNYIPKGKIIASYGKQPNTMYVKGTLRSYQSTLLAPLQKVVISFQYAHSKHNLQARIDSIEKTKNHYYITVEATLPTGMHFMAIYNHTDSVLLIAKSKPISLIKFLWIFLTRH